MSISTPRIGRRLALVFALILAMLAGFGVSAANATTVSAPTGLVTIKQEEPVQAIDQTHPIDTYLESQGRWRYGPIYTTNYTSWAYTNAGEIVIDNSPYESYLRFTPPTTGITWDVNPGEFKIVSGQPGANSVIIQKNSKIGEKYLATFNHDLVYGVPYANMVDDGAGNYSQYMETTNQYGVVIVSADFHWSSAVGGDAAIVKGSILNAFGRTGGIGVHGYAKTDEVAITGGVSQAFTSGSTFYWSSATSATYVKGGIGAKFHNAGGTTALGFPKDIERKLASGGVVQAFEKGKIYWSSATGARITKGAIGAKYEEYGAADGSLGYPKTDEYAWNGYVRQDFQGGYILWQSGTPTKVVYY